MRSTRVAFEAAENRDLLRHLGAPDRLRGSVSVARDRAEASPSEVDKPYMTLGTHPDLVERLWDVLQAPLPVDCRWIVHGTPALVHPTSGVVFAYGTGTHGYALRLPGAVRSDAGASSRGELGELGPEWVAGHWSAKEIEWIVAAFAFAGEPASTGRGVSDAG